MVCGELLGPPFVRHLSVHQSVHTVEVKSALKPLAAFHSNFMRNIRRKGGTIDGESLWVGSFLWLPWQPNTIYSKIFSSILAGQISYKKFTEIFLEGLSFKIVQRFSFCKKRWLPGSGAYFLCMVDRSTYSEFFENLFKNKWAVLKFGGGEISWWPSNSYLKKKFDISKMSGQNSI